MIASGGWKMSKDAEKTVLSLPEVKACRIFYQGDELEQIYVSADISATSPTERLQSIKSLVRSIVGVLALEHDWNIDYRKVKIVDSLETEPSSSSLEPVEQPNSRIRIMAAYIRYLPEPKVSVELGLNDSTYAGHAPYNAAEPARSAVEAFLEAFNPMDLGQASLIFVNQLPESLSHSRLVIVKLRLIDANNQETELLGIAESKQDLMLCTVRACLSALNRKIAWYR